jgi:adenylate cyclase
MKNDSHPPNDSASEEMPDLPASPLQPDYSDWPERRSKRDRRSGKDWKRRQVPTNFPDQRRKADRRKKALRIPIFIKLMILSSLFIFIVIAAISLSMLERQKRQFTKQLINLGESMARVVATNARDKLLGEEDLALFQLVDDVAQNDQVLYAVIVGNKLTVKAHSHIDQINKPYVPPESLRVVKTENGVITSVIMNNDEEALFFELVIIYQKLKVGKVYLAISQARVSQNIQAAKRFLWMLTGVLTLLGALLSLVLSIYFSKPIKKLGQGTRALGLGDFNYRVDIKRNDEFGDLAYAFNRMAEDLKTKELIKNSFGRYVTPEIVDRILANPDNQWMKGARVSSSVLFVDIRGFASLSENKDPEGIVELLNAYFTCVYDAAIKHKGHINKFVGDGAMVIFGAPVSNPRHAEDAVRAALDIKEGILALNREKKIGVEPLHVGIGINSGEMVAGNLGSRMRMEYTVIGDNVNIASRLTSLAKSGEILISGSTYDLIKDKGFFQSEARGRASVRGRKKAVHIFNVQSSNER